LTGTSTRKVFEVETTVVVVVVVVMFWLLIGLYCYFLEATALILEYNFRYFSC